jgi:hypothetical protein
MVGLRIATPDVFQRMLSASSSFIAVFGWSNSAPAAIPEIVNVVDPCPTHVIPSKDVASVLVPWPVAIHPEPVQTIPLPAVENMDVPSPIHVIPL